MFLLHDFFSLVDLAIYTTNLYILVSHKMLTYVKLISISFCLDLIYTFIIICYNCLPVYTILCIICIHLVEFIYSLWKIRTLEHYNLTVSPKAHTPEHLPIYYVKIIRDFNSRKSVPICHSMLYYNKNLNFTKVIDFLLTTFSGSLLLPTSFSCVRLKSIFLRHQLWVVNFLMHRTCENVISLTSNLNIQLSIVF